MAEVQVLPVQASYHKPLVLRLRGREEGRRKFSKSFKLEATWMVDEEYNKVVGDA